MDLPAFDCCLDDVREYMPAHHHHPYAEWWWREALGGGTIEGLNLIHRDMKNLRI
jgi:hypothetical protein